MEWAIVGEVLGFDDTLRVLHLPSLQGPCRVKRSVENKSAGLERAQQRRQQRCPGRANVTGELEFRRLFGTVDTPARTELLALPSE